MRETLLFTWSCRKQVAVKHAPKVSDNVFNTNFGTYSDKLNADTNVA